MGNASYRKVDIWGREVDGMDRIYEQQVREELRLWERKLLAPPGVLQRSAKKVQGKIYELIPDKVQQGITAAVKGTVRSVLFGMEHVPKGLPQLGLSLRERDEKAMDLLSRYQKIAAAEGAGTGAGGLMLALVDFPALIAIKMKMLFEMAHVYGYHTADYRERLFLLYVFQLAFSSQEKKEGLYRKICEWERTEGQLPAGESYLQQIDWEQFQREYRDAIDLRKLLQMVPGIGALIGAWANYELVEELGDVAMNSYRMRVLGAGL
jgi:uncharacterized protein (DUF697 family)